jgi:hypothetical protein
MYSVHNVNADYFIILAHNQKTGGTELRNEFKVPLTNDTNWITLDLLNGVTAWDDTKKLQVRRIGSQVYLRGELKIPPILFTVGNNKPIAKLPDGFAPDRTNNVPAQASNESYVALYKIFAGGDIQPLRTSNPNPTVDNWYSIDHSWVSGKTFW